MNWRRGREDYGSVLLRRRASRPVGSNPTVSAILLLALVLDAGVLLGQQGYVCVPAENRADQAQAICTAVWV